MEEGMTGNLYDLLERIRKRPSMYLGQASITHLRACLSGYNLARRELGISATEQDQRFLEFQDWIRQKFRVTSEQSWDKIILFYSEDERSALEQFFQMWEEFCSLPVESATQESLVSTEVA
jgi:hypothetical protein